MRRPRSGSGAIRPLGGLLLVAALAIAVAAGCGSGGSDDPAAGAETIDVFGLWSGVPAERFASVLEEFERASGYDVRYTGSADFGADLRSRIARGDPPDVAVISQPAVVAELARSGALASLPDEAAARIRATLPEGVVDVATVDGALVGVLFRLHVKDIVWYSPRLFEARGYEIPQTFDELERLTERMRSDGLTPWCAGVRTPGGVDGWVATDWIESFVLRLHGPRVYDDWVAGRIGFDDPRIEQAFELFDAVLLEPGQTLGGPNAILSVLWSRAGDPLLANPPRCGLHRIPSFWEEALPSGTVIGPDGDIDVFEFPELGEDEGALLIAGEVAAPLNDRPAVIELIEYLASPEAGRPWAAAGGFLPSQPDFDQSAFGRELERRLWQILLEAEVLRFDGSDTMPPELGSERFRTGMLELIRTRDVDRAIDVIEG